MLRNFVTAVQFLTILPVRRTHEPDESDLARSMIYFPVVGFLIGIVLVYSDILLLWLVPDTISNVLLLALSVLLTRGLHVDGLADTIDGLAGGRDRQTRLAIMKDSRIGTAGALGVFFLLLAKYAALNTLFTSYKAAALLTAPVFGRWAQMLMMFQATYAREQGTGKAFVGHLRWGGLAVATVVALGLSAFVIMDDMHTAYLAMGLPVAVFVFTAVWRRIIVRMLGGVTGDAVGAASELAEALTILLIVFMVDGR